MAHRERHAISRVGWLRAVVLGANGGLLSTSSLIIGVATADGSRAAILIAGLSGLFAGAMSMAAGEHVSVSSQADSEAADIERERLELLRSPAAESEELVGIYIQRGVTRDLPEQVAAQLTAHDDLAARTREELGISEQTAARPIQAAFASAGSFSIGAILPLPLPIAARSLQPRICRSRPIWRTASRMNRRRRPRQSVSPLKPVPSGLDRGFHRRPLVLATFAGAGRAMLEQGSFTWMRGMLTTQEIRQIFASGSTE